MATGKVCNPPEREAVLNRTWNGDPSCYNCSRKDTGVYDCGSYAWFYCPGHAGIGAERYFQFKWLPTLTISGESDG